MMKSKVDAINMETMRVSVSAYRVGESNGNGNGLFPAEAAALAAIGEAARDKAILDLGVGAGRTVPALRAISGEYTGLDYTPGMVAECRAKFPGDRFVEGDARDLSRFPDGSFFMVFFSCAGISMVDHEGRLAVLREVRRVLAPGGCFIFSTGNRDRAGHGNGYRFPVLRLSRNPLVSAKRVAGYLRDLKAGLSNRRKLRPLETHCEEYCIVNDSYHNYATLIYYITESRQRVQLADAGFLDGSLVFDCLGPVASVSKDNDITFVARVPG